MIEENQILYIEEIKKENEILNILLNKNMPPFYFDYFERLPYVKISILQCESEIALENIQEIIDPYNDGIIFKLSDDKKTITFYDTGDNVTELVGADIHIEEIEYNSDELWNIILQFKEVNEECNKELHDFQTQLEKTLHFIEKEIDRNQKLLLQIDSQKNELIVITRIKIDCWNKIKNTLKTK